jgi:hypothetical protein
LATVATELREGALSWATEPTQTVPTAQRELFEVEIESCLSIGCSSVEECVGWRKR